MKTKGQNGTASPSSDINISAQPSVFNIHLHLHSPTGDSLSMAPNIQPVFNLYMNNSEQKAIQMQQVEENKLKTGRKSVSCQSKKSKTKEIGDSSSDISLYNLNTPNCSHARQLSPFEIRSCNESPSLRSRRSTIVQDTNKSLHSKQKKNLDRINKSDEDVESDCSTKCKNRNDIDCLSDSSFHTTDESDFSKPKKQNSMDRSLHEMFNLKNAVVVLKDIFAKKSMGDEGNSECFGSPDIKSMRSENQSDSGVVDDIVTKTGHKRLIRTNKKGKVKKQISDNNYNIEIHEEVNRHKAKCSNPTEILLRQSDRRVSETVQSCDESSNSSSKNISNNMRNFSELDDNSRESFESNIDNTITSSDDNLPLSMLKKNNNTEENMKKVVIDNKIKKVLNKLNFSEITRTLKSKYQGENIVISSKADTVEETHIEGVQCNLNSSSKDKMLDHQNVTNRNGEHCSDIEIEEVSHTPQGAMEKQQSLSKSDLSTKRRRECVECIEISHSTEDIILIQKNSSEIEVEAENMLNSREVTKQNSETGATTSMSKSQNKKEVNQSSENTKAKESKTPSNVREIVAVNSESEVEEISNIEHSESETTQIERTSKEREKLCKGKRKKKLKRIGSRKAYSGMEVESHVVSDEESDENSENRPNEIHKTTKSISSSDVECEFQCLENGVEEETKGEAEGETKDTQKAPENNKRKVRLISELSSGMDSSDSFEGGIRQFISKGSKQNNFNKLQSVDLWSSSSDSDEEVKKTSKSRTSPTTTKQKISDESVSERAKEDDKMISPQNWSNKGLPTTEIEVPVSPIQRETLTGSADAANSDNEKSDSDHETSQQLIIVEEEVQEEQEEEGEKEVNDAETESDDSVTVLVDSEKDRNFSVGKTDEMASENKITECHLLKNISSEVQKNEGMGLKKEKMQKTKKPKRKLEVGKNSTVQKKKRKKSGMSGTSQNHQSRQISKPKRKVFGDDDYIPLKASGPTEFALAKLDKIKAYEKHDATTFREKMLFGDRVKRYSSSKKHEVYKLKRLTAAKPK